MSVVPPEFGLPPALFAHNGGLRQSTSALQLRDAFPAAFIRTRTIRPLSAFPACRYYFSSSLLLLVTHAITFFPVCQGKFIALLQLRFSEFLSPKRRYVNQIVNFQICDSTSGKTIQKPLDIPKSTNPIVNFLRKRYQPATKLSDAATSCKTVENNQIC